MELTLAVEGPTPPVFRRPRAVGYRKAKVKKTRQQLLILFDISKFCLLVPVLVCLGFDWFNAVICSITSLNEVLTSHATISGMNQIMNALLKCCITVRNTAPCETFTPYHGGLIRYCKFAYSP